MLPTFSYASQSAVLATRQSTAMYVCPHCNGVTIPLLAKLWSGSSSPAKCKNCGGLSYVGTFWHLQPGLVAITLFGAFAGLGIHHNSLALLGIAVLAWCATYAFAFHRAPLRKSSLEQLRATRWFGWAAVALAVVLVVIASASMAKTPNE